MNCSVYCHLWSFMHDICSHGCIPLQWMVSKFVLNSRASLLVECWHQLTLAIHHVSFSACMSGMHLSHPGGCIFPAIWSVGKIPQKVDGNLCLETFLANISIMSCWLPLWRNLFHSINCSIYQDWKFPFRREALLISFGNVSVTVQYSTVQYSPAQDSTVHDYVKQTFVIELFFGASAS
jgi:hypothetical protein